MRLCAYDDLIRPLFVPETTSILYPFKWRTVERWPARSPHLQRLCSSHLTLKGSGRGKERGRGRGRRERKGQRKVGRDDESELGYEFNAGGTMRYWPIPFDKSDNLFHWHQTKDNTKRKRCRQGIDCHNEKRWPDQLENCKKLRLGWQESGQA